MHSIPAIKAWTAASSNLPVLLSNTLSLICVPVLAHKDYVWKELSHTFYHISGMVAWVQACDQSVDYQLPDKRKCECAGDPSRIDLAEEDMEWTIKCDDLTTVTAFPLPGSTAALGYVTRESDKCALS